jgi:hypothetical protein
VGSSAYPEDRGVLNILGRLYSTSNMVGGAAGVMIIEDGLEPWEPVQLDRVISLKSIEVLERDEITPIRTTKGGAPEHYVIGSSRTEATPASFVHASRVITARGSRLSPRREYQNNGWGASQLDALKQERDAMHVSNYELGSIALKVVQDVVVLSELSEMLCKDGGEATVSKRLGVMAKARSQHKLLPLDGGYDGGQDGRSRNADQFVTASRDARGIAEVGQATAKMWASGTGQTPSIALGDNPGALNSGENAGDWKSWSTHMDGERVRWLAPRHIMVLEIVFAAQDGPTGGRVPEVFGVEYTNLYQPTQGERATTRKTNAETDQIYAMMSPGLKPLIIKQRFVEGNEGALSIDQEDVAEVVPPDGTEPVPGEELPEEGADLEQEEDEAPDALGLAWTEAQPPTDARDASELSDTLGVTANLVHKVAKDYEVTAYKKPGYPKVPLYSERDIKKALLLRGGADPASLEDEPEPEMEEGEP